MAENNYGGVETDHFIVSSQGLFTGHIEKKIRDEYGYVAVPDYYGKLKEKKDLESKSEDTETIFALVSQGFLNACQHINILIQGLGKNTSGVCSRKIFNRRFNSLSSLKKHNLSLAGPGSGSDGYENALYACINELVDVIIKHEKAE